MYFTLIWYCRKEEEYTVQGGFSWRGQFYKVRQSTHPTLRNDENFMKSTMKEEKGSFILSIIENGIGSKQCGLDILYENGRAKKEKIFPQPDEQFIREMSPAEILEAAFSKQRVSSRNGCPKTRKSLYVAVVADCGFMNEFQGSNQEAQAAILSDFNLASEIFERQFNIELGITEIHLMDTCFDPMSGSGKGRTPTDSSLKWNTKCSQIPSMEERLSLFSKWQEGLNSTAGVVHLVTGCVESEVVGIAWLNQVCQRKAILKGRNEVVSGTSISALVPNQFGVVAHEIGHNLGAIHDCTKESCSSCNLANTENCKCCACGLNCDCNGKYIMSPESGGRNVTVFSPCSYNEICRKMPLLASKCLNDPGTMRTINDGGVCGDGIRDPGEECDCGNNCDKDECCTKECKLRPGALCSDANEKCCKKCKFAAMGTVCRVANDQCQKDSICDGRSQECPKSELMPNLKECKIDLEESPLNKGQCASGSCTNKDIQCLALGMRLGITGQCPFFPNSCKVVCARDDGKCVAVDANFIDGTKCGEDGMCINGICTEIEFLGFLKRNKYFLAAIGVGMLILLIFVTIRKTLKKRESSEVSRSLVNSSGNNNPNVQHSIFYRNRGDQAFSNN
jgi:hypothetical protein